MFHDLVGDGFNVDHVIIGRSGVYTVGTKTFSKPTRKNAKVTCDGNKLLVDGRALERDPVTQSKAQARWVAEVLSESTGKPFKVRPVIVFPGWFVESSVSKVPDAPWVLNPKAIPKVITNESLGVNEEDVKLAAYHLSRHIRTTAESIER